MRQLLVPALLVWIAIQHFRLRAVKSGADRDVLTGVLSQSALRRRVDASEPFQGVVAVCDLDGFKAINDQFGHLVGDEVLRDVGNLLRASVRSADRVYRWGGDEFALLIDESDPAVAHRRMEAIQSRLQEFRVRGHGACRISISWGIAEGSGEPLQSALDRADHAMYQAKNHQNRGQ